MAGIYSRAFCRTRLVRPCRLPRKGPAILVCNHVSSIDPILLQSFSPRLVRWMMAKEYFEYKSLRWMYRTMGVILVDRGRHDLAGTRAAMRVLASGYVLGVFPEGRIEPTRELIAFQSGIGLLAEDAGAGVPGVSGWNATKPGDGGGGGEARRRVDRVCAAGGFFGPDRFQSGSVGGDADESRRRWKAENRVRDLEIPSCAGRRFSGPGGRPGAGAVR